ncbi:MAG TPA: sn-glycerol-3-phosphate ABC transporter ATP-binding protein UgpC [Streptosporangiaceae bacterium]|nr:sn-glycerol-3-phosphate ABC transporter ATP-binding protein UgpC [Streptosporangiaceae bacterium]
MSTVSLEGLTKVYANGVEAVSGLDLRVADGEFVVIVGPSGCGKTTALRMVAGLEEITSGTLRFGDRVVNDVSPRERDVAMVFQNYALYPHLSVHQNIGFSLANRKVPREERDVRVRAAAAVLGLSDMLDRKPRQLSGGQRQRVAMGRAIVREPSVFLMDEPLSNLDAKLRVQMRSEVLRVHRKIGVAALYVTHDQTEAMTMGDRVAVLRAGVLQQVSGPRELYECPANLFVATFIGSPSMNLYEAALAAPSASATSSASPSASPSAATTTAAATGGDQGGAAIVLGSQRLSLPAAVLKRNPALAAYVGRAVVVGIRPEHLSDPAHAGASPEPGTGLTVEVDYVEVLGSEQLVHFTIDARRVRDESDQPGAAGDGDQGEIVAASVSEGVARIDPRSVIPARGRAVFGVDVERLHFFDPDTGDAIAPTGRAAPG